MSTTAFMLPRFFVQTHMFSVSSSYSNAHHPPPFSHHLTFVLSGVLVHTAVLSFLPNTGIPTLSGQHVHSLQPAARQCTDAVMEELYEEFSMCQTRYFRAQPRLLSTQQP